jgi:hypothetical protein
LSTLSPLPEPPPDAGAEPSSLAFSPPFTLAVALVGLMPQAWAEALSATVRVVAGDVGTARSEAVREILWEIEADPLDIDDLKTELSKIDQQFSAVSKRFSDWEQLQKRIDEEHAADTF